MPIKIFSKEAELAAEQGGNACNDAINKGHSLPPNGGIAVENCK
jgi:hypothetical protein